MNRPAALLCAAAVCLALSACDTKPPGDPDTAVRESHHRLLEQFRSWARDTGESRTARHAQAVYTVELTDADAEGAYDVEVQTDLSARSAEAKVLAELFRTWWDGDDGDGTVRDLVMLDASGNRVDDHLFPALGNGGYDVTHYALTLDYTPEGNHLTGTAVITARATQDLSRFTLDFAGLRVRHAEIDGSDARFSRTKGEKKNNKLTLTPARPIGKGETFKTTVRYGGTPRMLTADDGGDEGWIETDDGVAALGEPTGSMTWFPGNHHPSDKATYDIDVTVPSDYTAVSNGTLRETRQRGKRTTYRWHNSEPMASYVATVVTGVFDISTSTTDDGLPVYTAVDPDEADGPVDVPDLVPEVVDWASDRFGPYPFSSTGAVVDHLPGLGYALETQTKPYFEEAPDARLVVHELAHQWFGNSVTPRAWQDMWLNEGFATYAEWLWDEEHGHRSAQETFDSFYDGTHPESEGIWDFPVADPPNATRVSDSPVYGRGAMTLHQLRKAVGDRTFFAILRTWTREHRHGNADTEQFIALCEKESGQDLSDLFETWLFSADKPRRT
ncbi:M1 family metallopeptidase [Streptomyces sp. NBC_01381]|uniref:M1 family metallopeptidase n=1 Tax=Streptomyces sp. NBC_01381 TaxID=2903845 RepID=UPI0022517184|nr:M1 family metallopeptidase [Streptomyces sp. NBC_01381]MCX4670683.1 M1 family metallopeptidase [Streptomyces sp. NBC_01381]